VEFALREGDRIRDLVAPGGQALTKADLPRLASTAFFEAVLKRYKGR